MLYTRYRWRLRGYSGPLRKVPLLRELGSRRADLTGVTGGPSGYAEAVAIVHERGRLLESLDKDVYLVVDVYSFRTAYPLYETTDKPVEDLRCDDEK